MTIIHTGISDIVQAKVAPVVAERIMAQAALHGAKALLTRAEADLCRLKHANHRLRVRTAVLAVLLAGTTAVATASFTMAERNDSNSGRGNGEAGGGGYRNGADRPQPYSYKGYLSPYGGISEPGCHVCSGGGQSGYASQASRNGF